MDASVVFSGEATDKRSGPAADHMSVSVGEDETAQKLSSPPEHPRLMRLRHRRLMAYLQDQGFYDSYDELMEKTRAHMSVSHLRCLVERGQWGDAVEYLERYLPPAAPTRPRSFHAQVLHHFLEMHHRFANAVDGTVDKFVPRNYHQLSNARAVTHAQLRLRSISFAILAVDEVRTNMDWQIVRNKASLVVYRLAHSTPELRGCIQLPATSIKPHHVLPVASGLWSRRRYVKKKQTGRTKAIIRALKSQRPTVPKIGSLEEAQELLADLLDETVRDGVQLITYGQCRPLQPGGNEGAQFCQPMFGTSTEAKTSGTLESAGAQFCQPMFGTSTAAFTSRTLANAGTNQHVVEAGCHTNTAHYDLDGRRKREEQKRQLEQQLKQLLCAQLYQPMLETFSVAKTSGTLANAGTNQSKCPPLVLKYSLSENIGTDKLLAEPGSHTNTARQDLNGRRNSREEWASVEEDHDPKRQRSTGAFGEASLGVSGPGAVENLGAKLSGVSSG